MKMASDRYIAQVVKKLNLRPRKCIGFRQPAVVFNEQRQAAQGSVALVN
jgi:IS30 family transposase